MASLRARFMRLEARLPREDEHLVYQAAQATISFLLAFLSAAFPDTREPLAAHFARMFGLPNAPAMRALLRGEDAQAIARERYGPTWQEDMEATAAVTAAALEAAHGSDIVGGKSLPAERRRRPGRMARTALLSSVRPRSRLSRGGKAVV